MKVAWQILRGERVPRQILIPVFPITAETHESWRGWNEPPVRVLDKPWDSHEPRWRWELRRFP